jgi:hypothetical protein
MLQQNMWNVEKKNVIFKLEKKLESWAKELIVIGVIVEG